MKVNDFVAPEVTYTTGNPTNSPSNLYGPFNTDTGTIYFIIKF